MTSPNSCTYHDHLESADLQALAVAQCRDFVHTDRRRMRERAVHSMFDLFLKTLEAVCSTQQQQGTEHGGSMLQSGNEGFGVDPLQEGESDGVRLRQLQRAGSQPRVGPTSCFSIAFHQHAWEIGKGHISARPDAASDPIEDLIHISLELSPLVPEPLPSVLQQPPRARDPPSVLTDDLKVGANAFLECGETHLLCSQAEHELGGLVDPKRLQVDIRDVVPGEQPPVVVFHQVALSIAKDEETIPALPEHASGPRPRAERCTRIDSRPGHVDEVECPDGEALVRMREICAGDHEVLPKYCTSGETKTGG